MRIGFIVNPIAGMGGRVGLKGTDGVVDAAVALGAAPIAPAKAARTLARLRDILDAEKPSPTITWLTCSGPMGEEVLRAAAFQDITVIHATAATPSVDDTVAAARAFVRANAELIVFCGGDGTARDIAAVAKRDVPILGIPSGVKMYSGVFGVTTIRTAELIAGYARGEIPLAEVDVVDLDEDRYREDEWAIRLFCTAVTPYEPTLTQVAKALITEVSDRTIKAEIAEDLCEVIHSKPDAIFLLGPGSTVKAIANGIGVDKTLLGIDALRNGQLIGNDLNEAGILELLESDANAHLVVSPIGAQGFVLGRGNLQISPDVIRTIGIDKLIVVATPAKLQRTSGLRFDTGDADLDAEFIAKGYISVTVGFHRRRMVAVSR